MLKGSLDPESELGEGTGHTLCERPRAALFALLHSFLQISDELKLRLFGLGPLDLGLCLSRCRQSFYVLARGCSCIGTDLVFR